MKNILTFLLLMVFAVAKPQMSILFVDDNGYITSNSVAMKASMDNSGYSYDLFSARDSMRSPTAAEMAPYYLVIWYCSSDGVGNFFWNGTDTDNPDIIDYLNNGGILWVMGTDLLYDRYGSAPDNFSAGDFTYDYMGISAYNVQAYGDDGGLGVPQLDLAGEYPLPTSISWIFSTAWWVDGCTPVDDALGIYKMGPESYTFNNYYSGILKLNENSAVLSFLFDPAIINTDENRHELVKKVLDWFAPENTAPEFITTPVSHADVGYEYTYIAYAIDADGDNITYGETNLPQWLQLQNIGDTAVLISGIPQTAGNIEIEIFATDGIDTTYQTWTIEIVTGIKKQQAAVNIYPNPAKENIYINSGIENISAICVSDISGKIILTEKVNSASCFINLNTLTNGVYFIKIYLTNGTITNKLFSVQK